MLWDLNDGKHLHTLDHNDIIEALCFSPNRYWLCAAFGPSIKIWVSNAIYLFLCIIEFVFIKYLPFRIWKAKKWSRNFVQKLCLNLRTVTLNHQNVFRLHGPLMDKRYLLDTRIITLEFGKCLSVPVNIVITILL